MKVRIVWPVYNMRKLVEHRIDNLFHRKELILVAGVP
jgi:hypothetical protein